MKFDDPDDQAADDHLCDDDHDGVEVSEDGMWSMPKVKDNSKPNKWYDFIDEEDDDIYTIKGYTKMESCMFLENLVRFNKCPRCYS